MAQQNRDATKSQASSRILEGEYSQALKKRVAEVIAAFAGFDHTRAPGIPYISAWSRNDNIIWYEFAGREFTGLFNCGVEELAGAFRTAVVDHRVFHSTEVEAGIQETVLTRQELASIRSGLRAEVAQSGMVEAVYRVALPGGSHIWLKDRARVETYEEDALSLSLGYLTDVTNEMVHKDLLEKIGYFDHLTNLPNRMIMERSLELKIAELSRGHIRDFTFLIMDLDKFKNVNDTYGHQAGDYVLAATAEVMTMGKRREDEIGRFGGEEFYGIALGGIEIGRDFAERLRQRVEATPFVFDLQKIDVTVSIGLVAASEVEKPTMEKLLARADKRLYRAKEGGRNRVVWED